MLLWLRIVSKTKDSPAIGRRNSGDQTVGRDLDATWGKGFFNGVFWAQVGVFGAFRVRCSARKGAVVPAVTPPVADPIEAPMNFLVPHFLRLVSQLS